MSELSSKNLSQANRPSWPLNELGRRKGISMSLLRKSNDKQSSRRQIAIEGVDDGMLILPSHRYRIILEASSINFELKSEDEQDALIDTYQAFLNGLACPLQIIIR